MGVAYICTMCIERLKRGTPNPLGTGLHVVGLEGLSPLYIYHDAHFIIGDMCTWMSIYINY